MPNPEDSDATGDVKYHHGARGEYTTPVGTKIAVELANNPSHLEAVDGVVEGMARCLQTDHAVNPATLNTDLAAPILIHGDAAFAAQGVVAEVLNLQALPGYATGGTIHIISNNQVGFTTDPYEARSTRYASDLAKGYDLPIVHVNADDVEACIAAVHLAIDYRRKFGRDVIVDLIGYRRFGHNEQDEPAYTQPRQTELIKTHPTVRELYASQLVAQGVITQRPGQGDAGRRDRAHRAGPQERQGRHARAQAGGASRAQPQRARAGHRGRPRAACCAGATRWCTHPTASRSTRSSSRSSRSAPRRSRRAARSTGAWAKRSPSPR